MTEAGERAASEAERAEPPRAQLRENIEYVMAGLRSAAAQAHSQAGSNIGVEYSLPPERDDGYRRGPSKVYATVPQLLLFWDQLKPKNGYKYSHNSG